MTTDKINRSLRERFAQPLKDCYVRRIIFWYDSEREFESMLDELDLSDVKLLRLTGDNFFEAKMLLSETDLTSNYLVYHPISMPHVWDDWLRDIELYSEEFRADLISMQMDELNIPQTVAFRRAVRLYQLFFSNKERVAHLAALHTKYETAAQLHIDIMAVLSSTEDNSAEGVIRAILCDTVYSSENTALEQICKFGSEDALRDMLVKYTGYAADEINLYEFAKHLMITALSVVVQPLTLTGLEKYISADNQPFCYNAIDEWAHSEDGGKLFELANDISQELDLCARLEKQGVESLLDADCLPCIDECLISHYMNEISEDVIKSADILSAVDKRRTGKWHKHFEVYYDGLYAFAQMHAFYLEHITGFHYGTAEQLWKAYCDELCLMDTYYRRFHSDASIAFEGNTFRSVSDMLRTTNLFEPFPEEFNNDSAFFDRIHAYLPGWETPKLRASLFTVNYGLITDCFSEFCHEMRRYDFTNAFAEYFELNGNYNTRDDTAVRRTFSGLAKLIYPDERMSKEEVRELLEYSIECRRRVKEQLRKMNPAEFSDVSMGYIDIQTGEEKIVELPESAEGSLVFEGFEKAGYVYAVGRSVDDRIGIYRLENKLIDGTGRFSFKNVEGLARSPRSVKDSLTAAFNYFEGNVGRLISGSYKDFDYSLYFNDLQNRGVSDEVSVAEVVGLFSAIANRSVLPGLVICGRVVMSGSMMPIVTELDEIFVAASNAGAKHILLPLDCKGKYESMRDELKREISVSFYSSPLEAAEIALGVK